MLLFGIAWFKIGHSSTPLSRVGSLWMSANTFLIRWTTLSARNGAWHFLWSQSHAPLIKDVVQRMGREGPLAFDPFLSSFLFSLAYPFISVCEHTMYRNVLNWLLRLDKFTLRCATSYSRRLFVIEFLTITSLFHRWSSSLIYILLDLIDGFSCTQSK